jgi:hypothetical protein
MKGASGPGLQQEKAWPWLLLARIGIALSVINGVFQVSRILLTNATTLTALLNDNVVVGSLASVAGLPLLIGLAALLFGVGYQRNELHAFRPERRSRRIAIVRTALVFLVAGLILSAAFAVFLMLYR